MPKDVQFKVRNQFTVRDSVYESQLRRPVLGHSLGKLKAWIFSDIYMGHVGYLGTTETRASVCRWHLVYGVLLLVVLLFVTFYIYLYILNLRDNKVAVAVLYTLAFSELFDQLVVGPMLLFLFAVMRSW